MRSLDQEMNACQRYWAKSYDLGATPGTASSVDGLIDGVAAGTARIVCNVSFRTRMRLPPTVLLYSYTGTAGVWTTTANTDTAAAAANFVGDSAFCEIGSSGLTSGNAYYGHWTANARL